MLANLIAYFRRYWDLYVRFHGDTVLYLRHQGVRIGEGSLVYTPVTNFSTEPWLIEIGKGTTVTHGVVFLTHDGASRLFRQEIPGMNPLYGNRFGTIWIGDNCFIGQNSLILPDVRVGPDSIVGAGSLVNQDVPPRTIYAGNPARYICTLDEYIERYQQKMFPVEATDRESLRRELTKRLWGEER